MGMFRGSSLRKRVGGVTTSAYLPLNVWSGWADASLIDGWKMDEASGTRVSVLGLHDFSEIGGSIGNETGKIGNAAKFTTAGRSLRNTDAGDDFDFTTGQDFAVSMWFKKPTVDDETGVIGKTNWTNPALTGWAVHYATGANRVIFYTGTGAAIGGGAWTPVLTPEVWYHIVCYYDGASTVGVITNNGVADTVGIASIASATGNPLDTANAWLGGSNPLFGLDEVYIFGAWLGTDWVAELYNGGAGRSYPE